MKIKAFIILTLAVFTFGKAKSQDFHLSMYDAAPMFLNPAMTGLFDGDWRIHTHYRTQWKSVNFKPYNTALISIDAPYKKWGFGGQIINSRAGYGNYNALQGLFSLAYSSPIDANKNHNISFGTQFGLTQKSVEYQLHSFNNQYTSQNGGGFNTSLPSGEDFLSQSIMVPDVNAGLMYYYARQQSVVNPFVGFSAFNLLRPTESFFFGDNRLPMRFYLHAGTRVNITETFYLIPKVLWMQQEQFNELTLAVDAGIYLKGSELYLLTGATYRNEDALVFYLGAKKANYIAKIGYDINTSS
ncbi:MAG: PorP/SprF family type IX secretion system membrane protein, partial [Flavobacteriales bacterium]|nr:PorP/SprF family type IX secretion system membrane protein [Flavobacteriales bacterium]